MNEIRGNAKNLRTLLANAKFAIDYYQREYRWETKQVTELIEDLSSTFLDNFTPGDAQKDVKRYGHYFLGSVIVSEKDGRKFVIDGAQSHPRARQGTFEPSESTKPGRNDQVPGNPGRKRPEDPPAETAKQASPYPYPSENPPSTAPSRLATLAGTGRWKTPRVRAAGRRMPAVPLTPLPRSHLPRSPATAIVLALVASRPLVLTLIVATFSS